MPVTYRIHPAIGIARVGDSLDDFFVGPEAPGIPPARETRRDSGGPRPIQGRVAASQASGRAVSRLRVHEDDAGAVTGARDHRRGRGHRMGGPSRQSQGRGAEAGGRRSP